MESLGFEAGQELTVDTLTTSVVSCGRSEGEALSVEWIRSSMARQLGLETAGLYQYYRSVDGIGELMLDAKENCAKPITTKSCMACTERCFPWLQEYGHSCR